MEEIDLTFESLLEKSNISKELKEKCMNADILIIPPKLEETVFSERTGDIFQFIKNNLPIEFNIEIPVEDEDYKETAFYEPITLAVTFLVSSIAIPILVEILSHFIIKKLKGKEKMEMVKFTYIVDEKLGGKSKKLKFKGNYESFKIFMENINKIYKKK